MASMAAARLSLQEKLKMEMREKKMKVAGNLGDGPFLADAPTFS
jgi:hypothetical protein